MAIWQFGGIQHIPQLSDLLVITCEYGLVDINVIVIGHASKFWKAHKSSIDFPYCSRDDQEWFSAEFECCKIPEIPALCLTYHHQS